MKFIVNIGIAAYREIEGRTTDAKITIPICSDKLGLSGEMDCGENEVADSVRGILERIKKAIENE